MLQVLHKILAIIIALVVLFSSLSFTVEKHVCMGEITDVSYFNEADNCGMTPEDCDMEKPSEPIINKEKCCNDVHELVPGNQNEQQALKNLEIDQLQFILSYTLSSLILLEEEKELNSFLVYSPPLVDKDVQVLYQTFLI
jgi:hypothetical protein